MGAIGCFLYSFMVRALNTDIDARYQRTKAVQCVAAKSRFAIRKYESLDELTPYALRELVKAIYIEAPDKSSGKRHQGIRISYDLVGFIPVEELLEQETA